jgi:chemotaxis protein methyltransferase CheR
VTGISPVALGTLGRDEFRRACAIVYDVAGIAMGEGKEGLVSSRLSKRVRELGLPGYPEYLARVEHDDAELAEMVDRLTTNKTNFFRERAHFDWLRDRVLPAAGGRALRLWSAGCSSGEEPYTMAMVLHEATGGKPNANILATDISARMLAKARDAMYMPETVADVPPELVQRHFQPAKSEAGAERMQVREHLRRLVRFARLNLMEQWPIRGPFDAIFCRNVMIYFDRPTQERLVNRFHDLLVPGGHLFIGHSETLHAIEHGYAYAAPAVYVRP